jgi:lipopolysaccharide export system ATP-binding protein
MTRDQLTTWIDSRDGDGLSEVVALHELIRAADGEGRVERARWMAAIREAMSHVLDELGSHGASMLGADADAFGAYVDGRVLPSLEAAGLARRDGSGATWETVAVDRELWNDITGDLDSVTGELETAIRTLEDRRSASFDPGSTEMGATLAQVEGRSRVWGEGLTKVYRRRTVVDDVDISVEQGQIVGLLGPNGAGKTTTFYMMVGLIPPNDGKVYLDGEDLTGVPMFKRARKGMGYLAQEPSIFRKLTVEENVLAILETLSLPKKEEKERLEQLLSELGLRSLRKNKAYSLSGGERRRLEITRALVQRPKFMLLDEPFAGIDPIAVNDIQQIVRGLKSRNIGVIISDHNVEQTLEIVDRAYIMYEGRIRVSGTVSELVWNDEVAEIYLGPSLTTRMRSRYAPPETASAGETVAADG